MEHWDVPPPGKRWRYVRVSRLAGVTANGKAYAKNNAPLFALGPS